MATVLDFGMLEYFSFIFPVILIFALVYALLHKTQFLGKSPAINAIVAIVIAFLMLLSDKAIELVNFVIPWFAVGIVFLILLIMILQMFGVKETHLFSIIKDKAVYWTLLGVSVVILIAAFGSVFGQDLADAANQQQRNETSVGERSTASGDFEQDMWAILFHPKVLGLIILFTIAVFATFLLTGGG